ncbi:MAG TPA: DUF58 domain-containing protein [Anaerolineaceae bacterium]|nr:DUF58 domain-containing protein [Anaerolineaceae bacterium]
MRVRRTFWVLLVLVALFFIAARSPLMPLIANQRGWTPEAQAVFLRPMYLLAGMIVICAIWAFLSVRNLEVHRYARLLRHQVGQVFEERIEVTNHTRRMRLWMEVKDNSPLPASRGSKVLAGLGSRQARSYITRTQMIKRGGFPLGPTVVTSGDPFGLFAFSRTFPPEKMLVVLPYMVELADFPIQPGMLPGGRALRRRSLEVSPHAASVREYAPGDPLSRIHWKTTARRDRLMVKEFEQDPQADVWIFVDALSSIQQAVSVPEETGAQNEFWTFFQKTDVTLPPHTFEYTVSSAASIANYFIRQGRPVGLACNGKSAAVHPAERGERQLSKILETLAFITSDGETPLLGLLEAQAGRIPRGSTVVLVTAATDTTVDLSLDLLMRQDLRPIVVFVDPASFGSLLSPAAALTRTRARGVPAAIIRRDIPLEESLETGFFS